MEMILGLLAMVSLPGYWVLQYMLAKNYDGGWRVAALAPLVVMLPLFFWSMFAFFQASNLWPLPLILASPFAFSYLALLSGVRAMT